MPKESNNLRNKKSQTSKPYDLSNSSFVRRATTRVLDLLPQTSWLSRWWAPTDEPGTSYEPDSPITGQSQDPVQEFKSNTTRSDLNSGNNIVEPVPSKRQKLHVNSPLSVTQSLTTKGKAFETANEELSPVTAQNEPSTSRSNPRQFTFSSLPTTSGSNQSDKVNGDDCSESSESTSGCSSLMPQAQSTINQRINDLNASGHNRSFIPNSNNMSLSFYRSSGRRPTFNATTFLSPLKSCMQDRTGLSPFYSGNTMYGGASASNLSMISTRKLEPGVRPVQPKKEQVLLSSTAKKILDALEQLSTPVLDAKRIPVTIGTKRKIEGSTTKRYSELNVPTTTDLLRVKRREKLQKSTSDARQTSVSSAYSNTPVVSYSPASKTSDVEYKLREPETSQSSHLQNVGKLRTKWKERPQNADFRHENTPEVRLPDVKLPLKSLPTIDIQMPSHSSTVGLPSNGSSFSLSTPLPDTCASSKATTTPTVNFTFSEPLSEIYNSVKSDNNSNSKSVMNFNFTSGDGTKKGLKTKTQKTVADDVSGRQNAIKPSAQLKTGSVIEALLSKTNSDKIEEKVAPWDSWQCQKCSVKNVNNNSICSSCGTQKVQKTEPTKTSTSKCSQCSKNNAITGKTVCSDCSKESQVTKLVAEEGFGNKFKKPIGSWECTACMLVNKPDTTKCVACETVKVGINKNCAPTTDSGFGDKFKPSAGSWECKSCLLVNKAELNKCAACETARNDVKETVPLLGTGFGNLFKKPTGSWDCESCMLQNSSDKNQCAACTTPKPGVTVSETKTSVTNQFSFGIPKVTDDTSSGLGGPKAAETSVPTFNFGINNVSESSSLGTTNLPKATPTFQFGVSNNSQASSTEKFSFGIPKQDEVRPFTPFFNEAPKSAKIEKVLSEDKQISSKIIEPKSTIVLTNSLTDGSSPKTSAKHGFEPTKIVSSKIVEKVKALSPSPFLAVQSTTSTTSTQPTSTTVASSASPNLLKFGSPKTISSNNETKSISQIAPQNTQSFNSLSEPKSGLEVKNIEIKPNALNVCNDTKPSFGGFQTPFTSTAPAFGVPTPPVKEQPKVSNTSFDTKNSTFTPMVNSEQPVSNFVTQTTTNIFGSTNTLTTQRATPNVFGSAETTAPSLASPFPALGTTNSFPSAVVNPSVSENKPAVFSFGAPANKPASFGFTAPVANDSSNAAGFVFNPVMSRNTGFNFTPKLESKTPMFSSNATSFGSVSNTASPVFGTPQPQSAPSFNDAAVPSTLFAFGSGNQTQQPASTAFGFGAPQSSAAPPAPASPAFVFGATPAASPVPAFDPNARPTFNFTGGAQPSTFTATPTITPSPAVSTQRKIRKAVRRQPRQN